MMYKIKEPGEYSFIGNPMVYEFETNSDRMDFEIQVGTRSEKLTLTAYKKSPYHSYPNRVRLDIADIVSAFIENQPLTITKGDVIHTVDNFAFLCRVHILEDRNSGTSEIYVFRGGISNKSISKLSLASRDMFTYRLNNPVYNPLFTTRTNGHHIVLRETELYPMVFIHPGTPVSFLTINGRIITQAALPAGTICSIDFEAVRQMFATLYGELPAYIVVQFDQQFSFDVTIKAAQITEERCQLLFRNSLGAFEAIEVTGKKYDTPDFSEENTWNTLNAADYFEENRDRLTVRQKIEAETGYKIKDELNFIQDLIASDTIYCIDGDNQFRCHVTVDKIKIARKMVSPNSIPLVIREVTDERFHTPEIDFSFPDNYPLANITRADDDRINGVGLIYGDDKFLYAE